MILLVDNYDSFVHTLARYVRELGETPLVVRNDALTLAGIESLAPERIIISPGPGTPTQAGISTDVVRRFGPAVPVLGVCLGHQCIGAAYGARIVRAYPMHGKAALVHHDGTGIFTDLPSPFRATRYHSLVISPATLPPALRVTATSDDGVIMAVAHRVHPVVGVQFHPESALTEHGYRILDRFLHGAESRSAELPVGADLSLADDRARTASPTPPIPGRA